jgi:hypothetical protein
MKGPLIKWFENHLYQRKQKVINRATSSTVCEVSAGVPQGKTLEKSQNKKQLNSFFSSELSIELYSSNN